MKMRDYLLDLQDRVETIASFGGARLVRTVDFKYELRGGIRDGIRTILGLGAIERIDFLTEDRAFQGATGFAAFFCYKLARKHGARQEYGFKLVRSEFPLAKAGIAFRLIFLFELSGYLAALNIRAGVKPGDGSDGGT